MGIAIHILITNKTLNSSKLSYTNPILNLSSPILVIAICCFIDQIIHTRHVRIPFSTLDPWYTLIVRCAPVWSDDIRPTGPGLDVASCSDSWPNTNARKRASHLQIIFRGRNYLYKQSLCLKRPWFREIMVLLFVLCDGWKWTFVMVVNSCVLLVLDIYLNLFLDYINRLTEYF